MKFDGFTKKDFDVFQLDGLEARMEEIKLRIRPKLEDLGKHFAPIISSATGNEMFYHTAKHARRTVNPPDDTWVAFANSKRGYKKLPHFQIGLFKSHLFIWFAVIYESPIKKEFADKLEEHQAEILKYIPDNFVWSTDHTKPDGIPHSDVKNGKLTEMVTRLKTVNKAEILCGIHIPCNDTILKDRDALLSKMDQTFTTLMPLYHHAQIVNIPS